MSLKQTRNRFSVELKFQVIQMIDNKTPFSVILDQFRSEGLTIKNIYLIKSQRNKIIEAFENRSNTQVKSIKRSMYDKLDKALVKYISEQTSKGVPINSSIIKEKANQLAQHFGYEKFKNSNGFLDKFRSRYSRFFQTKRDKINKLSDPSSEDSPNMIIPQLIQDYEQNYLLQTMSVSNETLSDDEEEQQEDEEVIDMFEALECIERLRKYVSQSNCSQKCFDLLNKLENQFYINRVKSETNQEF